ncbi:MAG: IS630 family transposase [Candidatus Competibacteraceae bacterium]
MDEYPTESKAERTGTSALATKKWTSKNLQDLVDLLGRSTSTIESWLTLYRKKGLLGLVAWNYHGGQPPAISEPVLTELREKLSQPQGFKNYGEVRQWLKEEYGLEIHYKTVYQMVHYKRKGKLTVAHPTPIKRDDTAVVEFKKKLPTQLELIDVFQEVDGKKRPVRYWSQDESRLGLHPITRRLLTLPGIKPVGPMQWKFEAFYLYGAVEPLTGENFFAISGHFFTDSAVFFGIPGYIPFVVPPGLLNPASRLHFPSPKR